jgi:hypothetical protein
MTRPVAVVLFCLIASPTHSFEISCDDVRAYIAEHGKTKALAFAIKHGATWKQIIEARKCLRS